LDQKERRAEFWHTTAHILADAVLQLYPDAKRTIGPAIESGFYYDFYRKTPFTPEDLKQIEGRMKEIARKDHKLFKEDFTINKAEEFYKDNKFKLELIKEFAPDGKGTLSFHCHENYKDLCKGGHLDSTGTIKAVKLLKTAGAYWRGDAKREQLQRIYGVSFPSEPELQDYLKQLKEAEGRNHVKIGQELELFTHFDLVGRGLSVWLPKGEIIKNEVEKFAIEMEKKAGYIRVSTPHLAKKELFEMSGHLPYYEDTMYPAMVMDDGTYYLKAMNCPIHHLIYLHKMRSYRDLPIRMAEYGTVYRNELSGTLTGLLRVRCLRMNDAHIYCRRDQIKEEVRGVLQLTKEELETFGIKNFWFRLSLGDIKRKDKYIDEPESWEYSEKVLREVLKELDIKFIEAPDEAAFYGPKIDLQFKNVFGREETLSTTQLDFAAKKRFDLRYIDEQSAKRQEVFVIHRAPLSTHERFMALLIEQYAGKFPLWLNPVQIKVLSITDRHADYAQKVVNNMIGVDLRAEVDNRPITVGKKIREAQLGKVNYMLVVGDKEVQDNSVTVRTRDGQVHGAKNVDEFIKELVKEVKERKVA